MLSGLAQGQPALRRGRASQLKPRPRLQPNHPLGYRMWGPGRRRPHISWGNTSSRYRGYHARDAGRTLRGHRDGRTLTVAEAADRLGITKEAVRKRIDRKSVV